MADFFDPLCTGKTAFETKGEALSVLRKRRRRTHTRKRSARALTPLDPYRCTVCGLWHLGNNKVRK